MTDAGRAETSGDAADNEALVRDLEQRIDLLQNLDEDVLGRLKPLDWWLLIIGAVILPVLAFVAAR